jgi:CHAT domain-containing protein
MGAYPEIEAHDKKVRRRGMKYMMRFCRPVGITFILFLFLVFLLHGCLPRMTVKETAHYKLYEDISLAAATTTFGTWIKTDIYIPSGAIVAVMAKGEVWDIKNPGKWHWQPHQCLRFKVGEDGREIHIEGGIDYLRNPFNLNVIPGRNGGSLYFGMGTWWEIKNPQNKNGKFIARVIVWEKGRQDRIESDLLELIRAHPSDQQLRDLVALMAGCFSQMGEFEKTQNLYKMIRETPEIDWARVYPHVLNACAGVERMLGRNEKAKAYSEEALNRSRRFGNRYMETSILRHMAQAASNLRQYQEAIRLLDQSLKIAEELKNPEFIGNSLWSIGENLLRMNRPGEAVLYLEKALKQFYQRDRQLTQRWCYLSLGNSYMRLNKNVEAKESFESAIRIALEAGDPGPQWRAHGSLGRIAEKEGDNQKAFEHYAETIKIIESMRAKFMDPELKALFMKDKSRIYELMIQLLYKMRQPPEALHYLERARARVMLDMLGEKAFSSKIKEERELLAEERTLRSRIDQVSKEQGTILSGESQEPEEEVSKPKVPEKRIPELERLQSQHRAILERIERLNPELASLVSINPLKAGEIQALLDADTALLEYFVGVEDRLIFVVTKEKVLAVRLKVDSERLFQRIKDFRARAVEGITLDRLFTKTYERPVSELYEILIQPIEGEISGKKHLVIVPHGMLHYLPFQALLSKEGKYLIETFTISYLPSASVLKYARMKNKGNRMDLFAAGNPATGLAPLPAAEEEVHEVSNLFEKRLVLTGREATKTSVKGQLPKYDLLHLSTHGEMIESDPLKSNLRFTPSGGDDGRLTVNEIFDMEIKANLVTLSACETALVKGEEGDFPQGDDLVGLSRAFIHAGTPSVVASLWKVSDDSTVELMRAFYRNLKGMSKAEALRKAQLDLMNSSIQFRVARSPGGIIQSSISQPDIAIECSHPFFWAPFILVGDWK